MAATLRRAGRAVLDIRDRDFRLPPQAAGRRVRERGHLAAQVGLVAVAARRRDVAGGGPAASSASARSKRTTRA
jgi:hypothetical protein